MKTVKPVKQLLVLAIATLACAAQAQSVKYFERPPTLDELQSALDSSAPTPAGVRTRGIAWTQAPAAASAASAEVAAAGAAGSAAAAMNAAPAIAVPLSFNASSSQVQSASLAYVEVVSQLLARNPQLRLTIEGHTDASGNGRRNMMLSWERAFAVFRLLVERYGVDPARLQPLGKGATEPLPNAVPTDPQNRRVQFRVAG